MNYVACLLFFFCAFTNAIMAEDEIYLRENLKRAQPGDYLVTAQNKTLSVLHIAAKQGMGLTIEEISVPSSKVDLANFSWKRWVGTGAPQHTSWVRYNLNLQTAELTQYYSFTKNGWYDLPQRENFLSTLLNLRLQRVPHSQRKRIGLTIGSKRGLWQPKMVVDGREIQGVAFEAWRTFWPKDGGELSGKEIEVYVPEENSKYPSYFPYWLEVTGIIGKAKVRIIDSGTGMVSPQKP